MIWNYTELYGIIWNCNVLNERIRTKQACIPSRPIGSSNWVRVTGTFAIIQRSPDLQMFGKILVNKEVRTQTQDEISASVSKPTVWSFTATMRPGIDPTVMSKGAWRTGWVCRRPNCSFFNWWVGLCSSLFWLEMLEHFLDYWRFMQDFREFLRRNCPKVFWEPVVLTLKRTLRCHLGGEAVLELSSEAPKVLFFGCLNTLLNLLKTGNSHHSCATFCVSANHCTQSSSLFDFICCIFIVAVSTVCLVHVSILRCVSIFLSRLSWDLRNYSRKL